MLPDLAPLEASLLNASGGVKLDARFRTLFTLKGCASLSEDRRGDVIRIIGKGFSDDSALLKHEMAYVLGQIQDTRALPVLEAVLADEKEHAMVRHEAAEAMGAISSPEALPVLRRYLDDADVSIRETCHLAVHKIRLDNSDLGVAESTLKEERDRAHGDAIDAAARAAAPIDPAPAAVKVPSGAAPLENIYTGGNVPMFREALLDTSLSLFERYRAMFALRNTVQQGGADAEASAVRALAAGLCDTSALFRHEICFVFGELCHPESIAPMTTVLNDDNEHEMVRHEAAEALGGVLDSALDGDEDAQASVVATLKRWADDARAPRVVRESCVVALDEIAYNNDPSQFQPMDGIA
ncbi:deoxyhypusine monooxygenase [Malassezia sp. CBS 17886]|nr:deoxyhypusine monooxygenase [Malassezia sp. CBS 17886]